MYESHFTHLFFRLWGIAESQTGSANPQVQLLGNSQNKFDALLGDVMGCANARYFIIEFKLARAGVAKELAAKKHRELLISHLEGTSAQDKYCLALSKAGHYAAYPEDGALMFEHYFDAAKGNAQNTILSFDKFYNELNTDGTEDPDTKLFTTGIGWPKETFFDYVDCMYEHLDEWPSDDGKIYLGIVDPKTAEVIVFSGTPETLKKEVLAALKASEVVMKKALGGPKKPF